jgi:porphobilinogen synthase
MRRMVRETTLSPDHFIYPLFTTSGHGVRREIAAMPGIYQMSPDRLVEEAAEAYELGVPQVLLFGVPDHTDEVGSGACDPEGVVQQAVRALKRHVPGLAVITDVCLCAYMSHGHCGVVRDGVIDNDRSVELLTKVALSHAESGADLVAPSDMMDGRVGAFRRALDASGYEGVPIMAYSAKFASAFYGPFREAQASAPKFGDRRSYQMDPANAREALLEVALDIEEGADIVMVKPALAYLDIIHRVRESCHLPLAAYNVSGEYAMVKAAAEKGWVDGERVMLEVLLAIRRAGADLVITYFAKDAARLLAAQR